MCEKIREQENMKDSGGKKGQKKREPQNVDTYKYKIIKKLILGPFNICVGCLELVTIQMLLYTLTYK